MVHLKQNMNIIETNLHDLMLNQIPSYPDLQNQINSRELFALRMVWLELGTNGYWDEGKEKVIEEFAAIVTVTLERTKWLAEQLYGASFLSGTLH